MLHKVELVNVRLFCTFIYIATKCKAKGLKRVFLANVTYRWFFRVFLANVMLDKLFRVFLANVRYF